MALTWSQISLAKSTFLPKSFKTNFTQEYKSALKGKKRKSQGTIEYSYPSKIRFEIDKPDKLVYVTNEKTSWYYTAPFMEGEAGTMSVRKSKKNGLHKFFDSLKNGLKTNKLYSVINKGKMSTIKFSKKMIKELDIIEANFVFSGKDRKFESLSKILMTYSDNHKIKMDFNTIKVNVPFKKGYFVFKAPKNTRINQ
jgi:outer membrane lipoprotein-sorting protein